MQVEVRRNLVAIAVVGFLCAVGLSLVLSEALGARSEPPDEVADAPAVLGITAVPLAIIPSPTPTVTPLPTATPVPYDGWVDPALAGQPYPGSIDGLLTFRGNPSRTFHGTGPVPTNPEALWRFGDPGEMCSNSTVGPTTSEWCGTGWTGQPAVFNRHDKQWVVFGSFAPAVHFLDAETGNRLLPDFPVGDLIKGSVTIDPDGYPLVYFGSRDDNFRIVAFDGDVPRELWSLSADEVSPTLWNDDWDSTALVLDDHLFVGGENSQWHLVQLNRSFDVDGRVQVDPELRFNAPGWDDELLASIGDPNVSIESSMTISGDLLWFANSGGLVQAWDIEGVRRGIWQPERVLRFWTGDDTDSTIVVDEDGYAYVGVQLERPLDHAVEQGQVIKLDPNRPDDPVVWAADVHIPGVYPDGVWATVALDRDVVYVPTNEGFLFALDRVTGETRWRKKLQGPLWSSPLVIDNVLIQADCTGAVRAFDVTDTTVEPTEIWNVKLPWCVESTPAMWDGVLYVGHRRGELWAIGDR